MAYCKKVNYTPDWPHLLSGVLNLNPDGAVQLAVSLNELDPPPVLPNQVVEMFVSRNMIKQVTAYLLVQVSMEFRVISLKPRPLVFPKDHSKTANMLNSLLYVSVPFPARHFLQSFEI